MTTYNTVTGRDTKMVEDENTKEKDFVWKKGQKYVNRCKATAFSRFQRKYTTSFKNDKTYRIYQRAININVGVVVIIKEENRKCNEWKF